ncbi:MAG: hypothetical protein WA885_09355 [Phormidesmis sp.]
MGAVWSGLQVKTKLPEGNPAIQLQHMMLKLVLENSPGAQPVHINLETLARITY